MPNPVTVPHPSDLAAVIVYAASRPEFVAQFNRLTGCNLGQSLGRTPIERLVDDAIGASGESEADMRQFSAFVKFVIWDRLPPECFVQETIDA